jgi:hypothetical protein
MKPSPYPQTLCKGLCKKINPFVLLNLACGKKKIEKLLLIFVDILLVSNG